MDITIAKNIVGIKTDKHDIYLTEMIPLLVEYAKEYCNQKFEDANGEEALPGPVKIFVAKAAEYNMNPAGVTTKIQGVHYSYETDFPPAIMKYLKPFKKLRWQ